MIEKKNVEALLKSHFAEAEIFVQDLTGTQDHYKVVVISDAFSQKSRVQRQQLVNAALAEPLKGPLHALTMETFTKEEAKNNMPNNTPRGISF